MRVCKNKWEAAKAVIDAEAVAVLEAVFIDDGDTYTLDRQHAGVTEALHTAFSVPGRDRMTVRAAFLVGRSPEEMKQHAQQIDTGSGGADGWRAFYTPDEQVVMDARRTVCDECPFAEHVGGPSVRCSRCGCAGVSLLSGTCPENKWSEL